MTAEEYAQRLAAGEWGHGKWELRMDASNLGAIQCGHCCPLTFPVGAESYWATLTSWREEQDHLRWLSVNECYRIVEAADGRLGHDAELRAMMIKELVH